MIKSESDENKFEVVTWREILKRMPNARSDWAQKRPLQKFGYLYGIGRIAMNTIAIPTFREDQTLKWFSFFGPFYVHIGLFLMLYTFIWHVFHGEFSKALPCTCMILGIGLSVLMFYLPILSNHRYLLHSLVDFGGRYIYRNHHHDIEYQMICARTMNDTMKHFVIKMIMMTFGFLAAITGPTYVFIVNGIRSTTTEVAFPFTEEDSWTEFWLNFVLQCMPATHGALFCLGGEVIVELFSNIITITPRLFEHELKKIIIVNAENRMISAQIRAEFTNLLKQSNDVHEYVSNMNDLLYWRSLVTPAAYLYSIGMSIYCQFTFGFAAGYGLAFMSWTQFFYFCELGQSATDNGFVEMLYDSDWYLLPNDLQKDILRLIHVQQNAPGLQIGPFGAALNRETFKIVTNKIYSFVMFLLNFAG